MGNIFMIMGNLDMTCFRGRGDIFQNGRKPYRLYDNMNQTDWVQCEIVCFLDFNLLNFHRS